MDDLNLKGLKGQLAAQLNSYRFDKTSQEIFKHYINNKENNEMITSKYKMNDILSAKNEWESCVDSLEHQAMIILDENLKVIRANRTVELWGWAEVTKVRGTHILNLIKPAIEHDSVNDWVNEWCQLDTQRNVEWVSNNFMTGKTFRFSFFPNRDIDSAHHNGDCFAVMLITDITNQENLSPKENHITPVKNKSSDVEDSNDLIRLSAYRLHQLANRLISSQEDERKRVSGELHDGLGQILSALKYQVESAVIESDKSSQLRKNDVVLSDILKNVTFALSELRRVSADLRPSILEDLGLLMTLKWFTKEYNKVYTYLNVDLQIDLLEINIPEKNKSIIYRIVQESMNNIAKHSEAKNIFVYLTKSESGLLLRITDDGCGFDLRKVKRNKKSGLGLKTMEERAVKSGAKFTMSSSTLSGTVVQVFWKID